ncbi:MAG: 16S rRNA (guanine(966)-N(2))-methyltransferase RsmD [Chloroflexi bacterium]|nr:16S rRNA (guanine(966)-N(2))-methyltransferase RsmD [Chloroflexota bacterium]
MVRVIGGEAKGRILKSVRGKGTRPITDRVKEALFNILGPEVLDARVLDLFGGTGAVGIEALSRGAEHATFVELAPKAYRVLRENLRLTGFQDRARTVRGDAFAFLRGRPEAPYDIVYIAPPQYRGMWRKALEFLDEHPEWVADEGLIVVQIDPREWDPLELRHFDLERERAYGDTLLLFWRKRPTQEPPAG